MSQIVTRDYQNYAINEGIAYFKNKKEKKNKIISAPCGSGKSIIIAGIANQLDNCIIFQPSVELLRQNYDKFTQFGGNATIFSASAKEKNISNRCFCTIGSVKHLAHEFKQIGVTNIIIDECHIFANKDTGMFKTFVKHLGTGVKILGLTATPYKSIVTSGESKFDNYSEIRLLNRMSPKMFSDVLVNITNRYIYESNYWKQIKYKSKQIDTNLLKLNSTGADYTEESLKRWYNFNDLDKQIIHEIETQIKLGKKTILIFVPNVEIATNLQQFIPNSEVVSSQTKPKDRTRIISEFLNKPKDEVKILLNFGTLTTGFDAPHLDLIISARATNSLSLYLQIVGRLVRKSEYVETGLFIDFTENLKKFGKIEDIDLTWVDGYGWLLMNNSTEQVLNNVRLDSRFDKIYKNQIVKGNLPKQDQIGIMPFGKFKDLPINSEQIETSYLIFCLKNVKFNGMFGRVNKTIVENELIRRKNIK